MIGINLLFYELIGEIFCAKTRLFNSCALMHRGSKKYYNTVLVFSFKTKQKIKICQTLVNSFQESKDRAVCKSSATKPNTAKVFQAEPRLSKLQLTDLNFFARPSTSRKPKEPSVSSKPTLGPTTSAAELVQPSTSTSFLPPRSVELPTANKVYLLINYSYP